MLKIDKINVLRGKIQVLWDVSLDVQKNEIVVLIGSNGAGKSTLLETIMGGHILSNGSIRYLGERIDGLLTDAIVEKGISYIPEGKRIFFTMTVLENLEMGAYVKRARTRRIESLEWVLNIFPALKARLRDQAGKLSGGMQQMLAIGRGLMSRPKLLMLDEPSLGLAPILVEEVFETIKSIKDQGITIVLIEQNAEQAMEIATRAYVLETGRITAQGDVETLLKDTHIKQAYMGIEI
jgi:branched-chain amino acid transport system ATP-binding protein